MQYNGLNLTTSPASYCASMHCTSARCCFLLGAFYYLRDTQKCSSHGREPLSARPIVPHFRKASQRRRRTGFESDSLRSLNDTGAHVDEFPAVSFGPLWSATLWSALSIIAQRPSPMTVRGDRRDEVVQRGAATSPEMTCSGPWTALGVYTWFQAFLKTERPTRNLVFTAVPGCVGFRRIRLEII